MKAIVLIIMAFMTAGIGGMNAHANPEHKHAYLGVAGPGLHADTWGGHAFVVFTTKPKVLLGGQAYQFNVKLPDPKLILSSEDGLSFVQRYINEDRHVTLIKLDLTVEQVTRLQDQLSASVRNNGDFGYLDVDNNCASRMVDWINGIVTNDQKIKKSFWSGHFSFIPAFLIAEMKSHPLADESGTYLLVSRRVTQIKANLKLKSLLDSLAVTCAWTSTKRDVVQSLIFNTATRYTRAFFDYLVTELKACNSSAATSDKNKVVDLVSQDLTYFSNMPQESVDAFLRDLQAVYTEI